MSTKTVERLLAPLKERALADLRQMVDSNSFTGNVKGLKATGDLIGEIAERNGLTLQPVPARGVLKGANHWIADAPGADDFFGIVGHFDTVHPPDSPFDHFVDNGDTVVGPGVQDMKSGIVSAIYGLRIAREATGVSRIPVKIVFNCDEETGSVDSRPLIEKLMQRAKAAFIFEGRSDVDNALVTSRKGIIMGHMRITGKASHAGEAPQEGASAIVEAAHKITALDALTDLDKGVVVTTGKITGGDVANQIADHCFSTIDIRFKTAEDEAALRNAVREIMSRNPVPGCKTEYALDTVRPPFVKSPGTETLRRQYDAAASAFGIQVSEKEAGGGSDGNLTAAIGVPTIDGVGPAGGFAHTHQEYIRKASLFDAIKVFALLVIKLSGTQTKEGSR